MLVSSISVYKCIVLCRQLPSLKADVSVWTSSLKVKVSSLACLPSLLLLSLVSSCYISHPLHQVYTLIYVSCNSYVLD